MNHHAATDVAESIAVWIVVAYVGATAVAQIVMLASQLQQHN